MRRILILILLATLVPWGCHKKTAVVVPAPAPEPAPPAVTPAIPLAKATPETTPIAKTIVSPSNFDLGELNFQAGNYPQAIKSYEAELNGNPDSKETDKTLFKLGLSRALAKDSSRDLRLAEAAFKRLVSEFPGSPYRPQAELFLSLQAQIERLRSDTRERDEKIKKLSDELQVFKDIDQQRRPSRPTP